MKLITFEELKEYFAKYFNYDTESDTNSLKDYGFNVQDLVNFEQDLDDFLTQKSLDFEQNPNLYEMPLSNLIYYTYSIYEQRFPKRVAEEELRSRLHGFVGALNNGLARKEIANVILDYAVETLVAEDITTTADVAKNTIKIKVEALGKTFSVAISPVEHEFLNQDITIDEV